MRWICTAVPSAKSSWPTRAKLISTTISIQGWIGRKQIRRDGVAVTHGEYVHDAAGIGAPVYGPDNKVIASIGLVAPYSRIPNEKHLEKLMEDVKNAAHDLSVMSGSTKF